MSDFWTYVRFRRYCDRTFCPWTVSAIAKGNTRADKAFKTWDSTGKLPATKHPRLLKTAIEGKKLLNFQIKEWVEGSDNVFLWELQEEFTWLPEWVWKAFRAQRIEWYFKKKELGYL